MSASTLPPSGRTQWFRRARVPVVCLPAEWQVRARSKLEPWVELDLATCDDQIVALGQAPDHAEQAIDLGGVLVLPGLLDCHTHLDKTHTWDRAPNPSGEFWDAIHVLHADTALWSEADLYRRASFALETAWAKGTTAIRTHLDSGGTVGAASFAVMNRLKREWADRITIQTVSLCGLHAFASGEGNQIKKLTWDFGATALGGFPQPNADLPAQLDALIAAAMDLGIGLDLHVDESGLVAAECLRATAEAVLRNRFPYPVACGHNCSLAVQEPERARDTLRLVKEAGIHLISLPLCNQYLQGRAKQVPSGRPGTPQWRGVTLVHEALDLGITVACASDNVRDAFYAWGDYDLLEVWQQSVRMIHLDTRMETSLGVVTTGPAAVMGLPTHGRVAVGSPASLVVTDASTFNRLLARPTERRRRIHGMSILELSPPSLSTLPE